MNPFWAKLPARLDDTLGCECVQMETTEPGTYESYQLKLRGEVLLFDDIGEPEGLKDARTGGGRTCSRARFTRRQSIPKGPSSRIDQS